MISKLITGVLLSNVDTRVMASQRVLVEKLNHGVQEKNSGPSLKDQNKHPIVQASGN